MGDQHGADQCGTRADKPVWLRFLPLTVILAGFLAAIFIFDVGSYLSFQTLSENREWLQAQVRDNALVTALVFVIAYTVAVAFSLPGATVLTILGGFLFGTWLGGTYAVIGATIGSVAIFIAARTAFYDFFHAKAKGRLARMEKGFKENALSYLLFLRLVPVFPFWLVNIVPGLLGVRLPIYLLGTALGIIPGTFVYASVGSGLGMIFDRGETPDLGIIFAPEVLLPLLALAGLSLAPALYKQLRKRKSS